MCPCCFNHGRQTHCPVVEKVQQSKHVQGTLENVEGALAETAGEYLDDVGSLSLSLPFVILFSRFLEVGSVKEMEHWLSLVSGCPLGGV